MFKLRFKGKTIECSEGENLRKALIRGGLSPYNGNAAVLNCRGLGTCGTCAIEIISGNVSATTSIEKWRLNFPPHQSATELRLSCQCKVYSDLELLKHPGFWGQNKE